MVYTLKELYQNVLNLKIKYILIILFLITGGYKQKEKLYDKLKI